MLLLNNHFSKSEYKIKDNIGYYVTIANKEQPNKLEWNELLSSVKNFYNIFEKNNKFKIVLDLSLLGYLTPFQYFEILRIFFTKKNKEINREFLIDSTIILDNQNTISNFQKIFSIIKPIKPVNFESKNININNNNNYNITDQLKLLEKFIQD
tara:strand:- start:47 stop:505 length:459 start_codon:yes stop_codon:yes gene_type:complete